MLSHHEGYVTKSLSKINFRLSEAKMAPMLRNSYQLQTKRHEVL
jgi:hypothetical protein